MSRWLIEPYIAWIGLGILVIAIVIAFCLIGSEIAIRVTGLVLETLSIGVIIVGIFKTRKFFGHKSLWDLTRSWIKRFPPWRRKIVFGVGAGHLGTFDGRAHIRQWATIKPEDSLEQRIDALSRNIGFLRDEFDGVRKEFYDHMRSYKETIASEREAREQLGSKLSNQLEKALTDGLYWSIVSVAWLLAGIVMSTMSVELTCYFNLSFLLCN